MYDLVTQLTNCTIRNIYVRMKYGHSPALWPSQQNRKFNFPRIHRYISLQFHIFQSNRLKIHTEMKSQSYFAINVSAYMSKFMVTK